ncbi:MAG: hypothetical protein ACYS32_06500 [Planctomycetota bacterium]|jgi:hypothetical protein
MAIEAPASKSSRNNGKLYIVVCVAFAIWLGYDGYFNKKFIEKNSPEGIPNGTLVFNRKAPTVLIGVAVLLVIQQLLIRKKKLVAEEKNLVFSDKDKIAYDSIEAINKTKFESKGYFLITYKDKNGKEVNRKISDRTYDNLKAILDHLVAEIT